MHSYQPIISHCFPQLSIQHCAVVAEGWDSVAVCINDEWIFRFPKRPEIEPQYLKETRVLANLAERLPLAVPHFEFVWQGNAEYPHIFVGHRIIPGTPLLRDQTGEQVAQQLAAFLSALHLIPSQARVPMELDECNAQTWRQQYRAMFQRIQAHIFPLLGPAVRTRIAADWHAFLNDTTPFQTTLIHADINNDHIMYDVGQGMLSGIIDWGDARIGDPALDFGELLHDYGDVFTGRVLATYRGPRDPSFQQRIGFYTRAIPFHAILFGLETRQVEHIQQGLRDCIALYSAVETEPLRFG